MFVRRVYYLRQLIGTPRIMETFLRIVGVPFNDFESVFATVLSPIAMMIKGSDLVQISLPYFFCLMPCSVY